MSGTKPKRNVANQTLQFTKIVAAIAKSITAAVTIAGKSVTPQVLTALFTAAKKPQAPAPATPPAPAKS
jgi:hypothetical protein